MAAEQLDDIPEGALAAYDGRFLLGWVFARGKEFVALRSDRTLVGTFAKELEARNALWCDDGGDS